MSRPPNPELIENIQVVVSDLVKQKGIDALTLRMIARRLSITATTIYYYYKDKSDLINKIKIRGHSQLDSFIAESIKPNDSCKNRLKAVILSFVKWCAENENLASLMFAKLPEEFENTKESTDNHFKIFGRYVAILKQGRTKGDFKITDIEQEASLGISLLYGMVTLYFNRRLSSKYNKDIELLAKKAADMLLGHLGITK